MAKSRGKRAPSRAPKVTCRGFGLTGLGLLRDVFFFWGGGGGALVFALVAKSGQEITSSPSDSDPPKLMSALTVSGYLKADFRSNGYTAAILTRMPPRHIDKTHTDAAASSGRWLWPESLERGCYTLKWKSSRAYRLMGSSSYPACSPSKVTDGLCDSSLLGLRTEGFDFLLKKSWSAVVIT